MDETHVDRPTVEAVVEDVLGEPGVLGETIDHHKPGAEEIWQSNKEQRQNAANGDRQPNYDYVDSDIDTSLPIDLGEFAFGDVGFLVGGHPSAGV